MASESGSHAEPGVLNYLEAVLEPAVPGRDWWILLVDYHAAQRTDPTRWLVGQHMCVRRPDYRDAPG